MMDMSYFNGPGATFVETAPRPPVPGEENELTSNGGTSTKSGSSGSHQSTKSHTSSNKSLSKSEHSPAATPRRSNLDKSKYDGTEAPLGFEPEGSAASSPPFHESTPPYLKWAENINNLLEDSDGANLYKQYLIQNHVVDPLEFWYACKGLKLVEEDNHKKIQSVVKTIYKRYIKSNQLKLNADIRRAITERLKNNSYTQCAFDEAQLEVEKLMAKETYLLFLKSDLYVQYVQNGGESPKTSNNSSGSSSVRPLSSGPLPTVPEGDELKDEDIKQTSDKSNTTLPLTHSSLIATRNIRANYPQHSFKKPVDGFYPSKNTSSSSTSVPRHMVGLPSPYHTTDVSYAPVSAQDSEIGSLSSDALTDDTMSLTDSSVDGREPAYGSKKWFKTQKVIRNNANLNKITGLPSQQLIPRPDRGGKQSNLAETDPKKFADLLISKLEKVKEERQKMERLHANLSNMETTDDSESDINQSVRMHAPNTSMNLLMAAMQDKDADNAQSILENHVSRVWDNSSGQTPSRSPGQQSPSPDRSRSFVHPAERGSQNPNISGISLPPKVKNGHKRGSSNYSKLDSDKSNIFCESESHKHIHHIHHHHHHITKDSSSKRQTPSSQDRSLSYAVPYVGTPARNISDSVLWDGEKGGGSRGKKPQSSKHSGSQSSAIDSGVSDVTNIIPITPQHDKVMSWMMENDKIQTGTAQYSTDNSDKCSSQRRSHKSATSSTHNKSGSSGKKQNASFDVGYEGPIVQPSQPFVQDPQMPIPNPPNPIVQLEEAKRRLEDESRSRISKSKSYSSGMGGKDRSLTSSLPGPPPLPPRGGSGGAQAPPPPTGPTRNIPHQTQSSTVLPSQSDVTVVGYYFCSEPIPYRSTLTGRDITLAQFKTLITRKGGFKFFFKTHSNEFGTAVVYEEVKNDEDVLPLYEGKIIGKVEKQE